MCTAYLENCFLFLIVERATPKDSSIFFGDPRDFAPILIIAEW
jgi:hypothetical protein